MQTQIRTPDSFDIICPLVYPAHCIIAIIMLKTTPIHTISHSLNASVVRDKQKDKNGQRFYREGDNKSTNRIHSEVIQLWSTNNNQTLLTYLLRRS